MKRKVLAGLLSFAMVFSLMPSTAVFAEEDVTNTSQIETQADGQEETPTETQTDNQNETQQEATKTSDSVTSLQNRIASLPSVEEFQSAEKSKQDEIYNEAQAISNEYDKLSEEEQGQLDTEKLEALFEYFNGMTEETALTPGSTVTLTSSTKYIEEAGTYNINTSTVSSTSNSPLYIRNTSASDNIVINFKGDVTVKGSYSIIVVSSPCNLTINGNGNTIKNSGSSNVFYVEANATVHLKNCNFTSNTGPTIAQTAGTLYIESGYYKRTGTTGQVISASGGTLYIQGGTIENAGSTGTSDTVAIGGKLYMTGGTIISPKSAAVRAGTSGASMSITGGTIKNSLYGVYVRANNPSCTIGNVTFSGNTNDVYLGSGQKFTLSTDYKGADKIKVGVADTISANTQRQITTTGTAQSLLAKVTSANSAYTVNYDTSSKYLYLWKHAHTWSYSVNGNTITAKCTSDSKCGYYSTGVTATLTATDKPYSGKAYDGASVTNNITSVTGASAGSIKYVGRDGTTYAESTTAPTNAGKYTASVTIGGKTAKADFEITKAKVTAPTADSTKFVYNGTEQTYTVADSDLYTVSNNTRTKAGKQTVIVSLKDKVNSEWADGTTDDVTFDFEIAKLSVAKPAKDTTAFVYNGKAQTYTVADSQYYTVDGNVRTDAGKQTVTIALKDTDNTEWKDGSVKEIAYDFEIAKLQVAKPTANTKSFVYNKQEQEYELANSDYYEITNNKRTNAGYQMVKVALKDTANTEWKDGTQDVLSFKFEIGKANPEVNVTMATDLVYNGSDQPLVTAGTTSGGTLKYQLNGGDWTTEIPTAKDAGTYTVKYKVVGDDNYNDGIETTEKVTIAKADLSVTESTYSGTYDGKTHEVDVSATPSAKITYKTSADSDYTSEAPSFKDAGTYTVDYKVVKDNYNTVTGTLTVVIDKKTVKVSGITANGKTYDGTTNATVNCDNAVFDGIIGNDKLAVTATGTFDSKDAGERTVTLDKLTLGGADLKNYQLADSDNQTTTTATITAKTVTAIITANGGVYDGTITGATATINGLVGEEQPEVVLTYTGKANDGTDYSSTEVPTLAGTYTVTATVTDGNYNLAKSETQFVINRANPNLIVSAVPDKNYGDNTFALEVSHDGDGALSFTSDKEKVATVDADGNVTIKGAGTAKLTVTLAESANYTAGTADVTIKVAKTPHGMTVDSIKYEKTYGDKPFAVTATADDSETNITYTSSDESVATVDENGVVTIHKAGTAEITVAMAESDNHTAVSTKITVDVKAKPVTVKAKDTSKTYGDNEPELSYEVLNDGLVEGDSLADVTVTRENGEDVKDGGYVMTATADKTANPNYDITFETGTFTINPKDISNATVALGTALKYTGKEQTQDIKTVTVDGIEVPADSYEVTGNTATEAGVYTLTVTAKDGSNFTGTKTWTYVVAPTKTEQIKENEDGKIELGNGTVTIAVKADDNAPKTTLVTGKAEIIDMLVKSGDITADELSKIANGASVDIVLTVKDASATVSNEAKSAMTDTASKAGYTIGQYIDISLYKYMTVDGVTDDGVQLHSTADKIKIAVQIPDSLINKDSKVNRTYYIVRYHDGKAEIIEGTYDEATHTFTFETDKFSDYAIAYKDVKVADKTTTDNSKKPSATKSVKTGDTSNPMLYGMLLLLSMMGIVLVFIRRRKSER